MSPDDEYEQWFQDIFQRTHPTIERAGSALLARFCPHAASEHGDLVQEAYLALYKKRRQLRSHPNITGWLIVALKYLILKRRRTLIRKHAAYRRLKIQYARSCKQRLMTNYFENTEAASLLRASLQPEDYALLWARYVEGVSIEDLAQRTEKSKDAVYTQLSRLRKRCLLLLRDGNFCVLFLWFSLHILEYFYP